jgi:fructokinase
VLALEKQISCIGELLIDFICSDINVGLDEGVNFIKKAGGAPANVAVTITRLGTKALFAGSVGKDSFGMFLKNVLIENKVDVSMLKEDQTSNTTLAFVSLKSNGERDFIFNRGADHHFRYEDLDVQKLKNSSIVHFGSATALLGGGIKDTYFKAMEVSKEHNILISFDPNYRVDLWKGRMDEFIEVSKECIRNADFVKVSDEELRIISGEEAIDKGVNCFHRIGAKVVTVTLGKDGTFLSNGEYSGIVGSIKINSIDSTGAGDAFVGAFLYELAKRENIHEVLRDYNRLKEIVAFANKVGAITCTRMGAISSIPTLEEVNSYR